MICLFIMKELIEFEQLRNAASKQTRLHSLVKGKRDEMKFVWSEEAKLEFSQCKDINSNATLLVHPVSGAQLPPVVDASDFSVSAVLQQNGNGEIQPLGFFSRNLSMTETKYSVYDRKLFAIYSAVGISVTYQRDRNSKYLQITNRSYTRFHIED